jgi:hypothetical protein
MVKIPPSIMEATEAVTAICPFSRLGRSDVINLTPDI